MLGCFVDPWRVSEALNHGRKHLVADRVRPCPLNILSTLSQICYGFRTDGPFLVAVLDLLTVLHPGVGQRLEVGVVLLGRWLHRHRPLDRLLALRLSLLARRLALLLDGICQEKIKDCLLLRLLASIEELRVRACLTWWRNGPACYVGSLLILHGYGLSCLLNRLTRLYENVVRTIDV
jgi:hypothetical protein